VVGFLLRAVNGREPGVDDLPTCKEVLGRFHRLGYVQSDVQPSNFIIVESEGVKKAWLVDFENARLGNLEKMQKEMDKLEKLFG
jgi:tRNA A-37 threonylcarbamoyl transferase component Bud32